MNSNAGFDAVMASLFVACYLTAGCASPHRGTLQTSASDQAQIEQRLQEVFAAAINKDFGRLDSYHLYGPKFTKFSGSSSQRLDASAGCQEEYDGLAAVEGLKMQADDLKIDMFGNVGVATFILNYGFDSGGASYP